MAMDMLCRKSAILCLLLAGCGVPPAYQLRSGLDPKNSDTDVRFRTTYYFRTFDYCQNKARYQRVLDAGSGKDSNHYDNIIPGSDVLYRYRMTGQAHSLTTNVKFESGTLAKEQIDPFGTDVIYDGDLGGFRVRSYQEAQAEATHKKAMDDYNRLAVEYQRLAKLKKDGVVDAAGIDPLLTKLRGAMERQLDEFAGGGGTPASGTVAAAPAAAPAAATKGTAAKVSSAGPADQGQTLTACELNGTVRRGFQILGPEGWRTFNQDERLLLAMYTDGEPLIASLQEYSGRILNSRPNTAEAVLPLVRENLEIVETQRVLDHVDPTTEDTSAIFTQSLAAFEPEASR